MENVNVKIKPMMKAFVPKRFSMCVWPKTESMPVYNFKTPRQLFDDGMCLCHGCGKLHAVDYAFCNDCFAPIVVTTTTFD